jgi:membrane fusion protein, multidrug efflux system
VLAVLLFFGLGYFFDALTHESTDDAFIAAHVVSIAPRIAGQVAAVHVLDNEMVRSNELLVEIDPADYSTTAAQKQSSADAQAANYKTVLAALDLMAVKVATAEATADQSKADADAAQPRTRGRRRIFSAPGIAEAEHHFAQEFDAAQAAVREADANLQPRNKRPWRTLRESTRPRRPRRRPKPPSPWRSRMFRQAQTTVQSAQLDLSYTKIFAPCDGRVTRKAVEAGNYRSSGPATHVHRAGGSLGRRQFQGIAVEKNEARPAGAGGH